MDAAQVATPSHAPSLGAPPTGDQSSKSEVQIVSVTKVSTPEDHRHRKTLVYQFGTADFQPVAYTVRINRQFALAVNGGRNDFFKGCSTE